MDGVDRELPSTGLVEYSANDHGTVTEEEEEEEYDDVLGGVLQLLNFKVVPKEPGDPGYYPANNYYPPEASPSIDAAEYCRFQGLVDRLTAEKTVLEGNLFEKDRQLEEEKEKVAEIERRMQNALKASLEEKKLVDSLTVLKCKLENQLASEQTSKDGMKSELEIIKKQLQDKEGEVEVCQAKLKIVEEEYSELKQQVESQQDTISSKSKENEEAQGIILEREQEIKDHSTVISQLNMKLEESQRKFSELQTKIQEMVTNNSEMQRKLATAQDSFASAQIELQRQTEETNQSKNDLEKSQQTIHALEGQLENLVQSAQEEQQKLKEAEKGNVLLGAKLKELKITDSNKQGEIEDLQRSSIEAQNVRFDLENKCKKLKEALSSLGSEVRQMTDELKLLVDIHFSPTKPNDNGDESMSAQCRLGILTAQMSNKFISWQERQNTTRDDLLKTKKMLLTLLQLSKKQFEGETETRVEPEPILDRGHTSTQSRPSMSPSSAILQEDRIRKFHASNPSTLPSVVRRSYRDVLLSPASKMPVPMGLQTTTVVTSTSVSTIQPINTTATSTPMPRVQLTTASLVGSSTSSLQSPVSRIEFASSLVTSIPLSRLRTKPSITVSLSNLTPVSNIESTPSVVQTTTTLSTSLRADSEGAISPPPPPIDEAAETSLELGVPDQELVDSRVAQSLISNTDISTTTTQHGINLSKANIGKFCLCGHQSSSENTLRDHIWYYTADRKFPCHLCDRRFVGANYLRMHYRKHHKGYEPDSSLGCRKCGMNFQLRTALRHHQKIAHPLDSLQHNKVQDCNESIEKELPLDIGLDSDTTCTDDRWPHHEQQEESGSDHLFSQIITDIESSISKTKTLNSRNQEYVTEQPSPSSACLITGISSTFLQNRKTPKRNKIHAVDLLRASQGCYCVCGKIATNQADLLRHIFNSIQRCRFCCKVCQMSFKLTYQLRLHMQAVHKMDYLERGCRICGKTFATMSKLFQHQKSQGCSRKRTVWKETQLKEAPSSSINLSNASIENQQNTVKMELKHKEDILKSVLALGIFCVCGIQFRSKGALAYHVRRRNALFCQDRKFHCNICEKRYPSHGDLQKHLRRVHKINSKSKGMFGCRTCGRLFSKMYMLRRHRKLLHESNSNLLTAPKKTSQENAETPPVQLSTAVKKIKLKDKDNSQSMISQSLKKSHGKDLSEDLKDKHVCICGHESANKENLQKHLRYHLLDRHFKCPKCPVRFKGTAYLRQHMRNIHKTNYDLKGCSTCGLIFSTIKELRAHLTKTHQLGKKIPGTSDQTPSVPQSERTLKVQGSRIEARDDPLKPTSVSRIPSITIPLSCKNISSLSVLKRKHEEDASKRHLGHYCVCGTRCTTKKNLTHHIKHFTIDRRFQCQLCRLNFVFLAQLKAHMMKKHKLNSFKFGLKGCSDCGKTFANFVDLMKHRRVAHTNPSGMDSSILNTPLESSTPTRSNAFTSEPVISSSTLLKLHKMVRFTSNPDLHICFCGDQFESPQLLQQHITASTRSSVTPVLKSSKTSKISKQQLTVREKRAVLPQQNMKILQTNQHQLGYSEPSLIAIHSSISTATKHVETAEHAFDKSKEQLGVFCICDVQFSTPDNLAAHTQFYALGKKFPCHVCGKLFSSIRDLNAHEKRLHGVLTFTGNMGCNFCGVVFASKSEYARHRGGFIVRAGEITRQPKGCPSAALKRNSTGLRAVNLSMPLPPTPSSKSFREIPSTLASEKEKWIPVTPSLSVRIGRTSEDTEVFTTKISDNRVESMSVELLQCGNRPTFHPKHGRDDSKSGLGSVCYCGRVCSNKSTLNRHIKRFTNIQLKPKFICKNCGEGFMGANLLRNHTLRVHKILQNNSIGCKDCGEFFPTNMELYHHYRLIHNHGSQVEPWETKYTPPTPISSQQELSQEQPFSLEAGRGSEQNIEIHESVPPDPLSENSQHQCSCGKIFASKSSLGIHVRCKTMGKIFKCSWCPLRFDIHGNLKKHVKCVHKMDYQKGKFACGVCAKTFLSFEEVNNHRRLAHMRSTNSNNPITVLS